jgi:dTDP-4-amino-4,6-dideoxygalactose transaminase
VSEALLEAGIESRAYYTTPLHLQPAMRPFAGNTALPNSERLAAQGLALPMGAALETSDVRSVIDAIRSTLSP